MSTTHTDLAALRAAHTEYLAEAAERRLLSPAHLERARCLTDHDLATCPDGLAARLNSGFSQYLYLEMVAGRD